MHSLFHRLFLRASSRIVRRRRLAHGAEVDCGRKRLGSAYGGWWICPELVKANSVVYSLGVGNDVSFDLALIDQHGVVVHAFDPTPSVTEWVHQQLMPTQFRFHPVGIAAFDGPARFYAPRDKSHISHSLVHQHNVTNGGPTVHVMRLSAMMKQLGHAHIDLLKMDIEGAEYDVIRSILEDRVDVRQLLVEFHDRFLPAGGSLTETCIDLLRQAGLRLFAVSDNGEEMSFVRQELVGQKPLGPV